MVAVSLKKKKRIRESKSISLERFAELTGISPQNCYSIENGLRALNSSEVQSICRVLGVSFDVLVSNPAPEPDPLESEGSVVMPVDELQNLLGKMRE